MRSLRRSGREKAWTMPRPDHLAGFGRVTLATSASTLLLMRMGGELGIPIRWLTARRALRHRARLASARELSGARALGRRVGRWAPIVATAVTVREVFGTQLTGRSAHPRGQRDPARVRRELIDRCWTPDPARRPSRSGRPPGRVGGRSRPRGALAVADDPGASPGARVGADDRRGVHDRPGRSRHRRCPVISHGSEPHRPSHGCRSAMGLRGAARRPGPGADDDRRFRTVIGGTDRAHSRRENEEVLQ